MLDHEDHYLNITSSSCHSVDVELPSILLIDDEPLNLEILEAMLEE